MLSINTNLSSLIAQNSMKTSSFKLDTAIERMTTGYKINHASDNAANYSISTNMTTKIGAYMVAEDNALQGLDMINTASESLSLIEDKLMRLRALATQASNGTYGGQSQKAINAEATALVDEIGRIYSTSTYNGLTIFETGEEQIEPEFITEVTHRDTSQMTSLASVSEEQVLAKGTYSIGSVAELEKLARMQNAGLITNYSEFVLSCNLDLSSVENWTPIGNSTNNFYSTFDGNGFVISNLKINSTEDFQGLFGNAGGQIKNLGVVNADVTGGSSTGILVGSGSTAGNVSNCYATGKVVTSSGNAGGLVGYIRQYRIEDCYADVEVVGTSDSGGLVGYASANVKITNSYSKGNVTSTNGSAGGLVGYYWSSATYSISNCYSTADVIANNDYAGGLIGDCVYNSEDTAVINCYASGTVRGKNAGGFMGGASFCVFENCYATGDVYATNLAGGFVGGALGYYRNCYATGGVTSETSIASGFAGRFSYFRDVSLEVGSLENVFSTSKVSSGVGSVTAIACFGDSRPPITISNVEYYSSINPGVDAFTGRTITSGYTDGVTPPQINADGTVSSSTAGLATPIGKPKVEGDTEFVLDPNKVSLQVGVSAGDSSTISFNIKFALKNISILNNIGLNTDTDFISQIDTFTNALSDVSVQIGAVQNRLESVLDEISIQYENLVSSRSTIRDADMAEVSSQYIRQQILQQASATLMSTANQSPSIALQLI